MNFPNDLPSREVDADKRVVVDRPEIISDHGQQRVAITTREVESPRFASGIQIMDDDGRRSLHTNKDKHRSRERRHVCEALIDQVICFRVVPGQCAENGAGSVGRDGHKVMIPLTTVLEGCQMVRANRDGSVRVPACRLVSRCYAQGPQDRCGRLESSDRKMDTVLPWSAHHRQKTISIDRE